jgi:hypothetical protein
VAISSWQAWSRSRAPKPATYKEWMTAPAGGGPSAYQTYLRSQQAPATGSTITPPTNPAYGQAVKQIDSTFADKGLMNSSAYGGARAQAADLDAQTRYNESLNQANLASRIWELLASQNLAKKQLIPGSAWNAPQDPAYFKQLFGTTIGDPPENEDKPCGDPAENESAPYGDPPVYQWNRTNETTGPTIQQMQLSQQASQNAASMALARDQFNWQKQQAANEANQANDPWGQMVATIGNNLVTDAHILPTTLMASFGAQYGIDLVGEAKKGNPKALNVLKMLYPGGTWTKWLAPAASAGVPGEHGSIFSPSAGSTAPAAAGGTWSQDVWNTVFGQSPQGAAVANEYFAPKPASTSLGVFGAPSWKK